VYFKTIIAVLAASIAPSGLAAPDDKESPAFMLNQEGQRVPLRERQLKTKGEEIKLAVDDCRYDKAKIEFDEKERNSRIYEDVRAILDKDKDTTIAAVQCPNYVDVKPHALRHKRSTLTVTAPARDGKSSASETLITGPEEHWYLSIDLPVTSTKQLKYDSGSRTLQPQDDKPQLYLSLNLQWGDVLSKRGDLLDPERLSLKFLVLADNRPLDSFGMAVGYQMFEIPLFGKTVDLSAVSLFIGHFWTKEDGISSNGDPQINQSRSRDWRLGIAYDVAAGLKYLK
jgi:hypothetical protein